MAAPTIAPTLTLEVSAVVAAVRADKSRYSEDREVLGLLGVNSSRITACSLLKGVGGRL